MTKNTFSYNLKNINKAVEFIQSNLNASKILLFYGEVGAGKTTFIKKFVKNLGSTELVSSPTFSIINDYSTPSTSIYHLDLYRVKSIEELYDFGIEDYLLPDNWLLVEWPQLLEPLIHDSLNKIFIFEISNNNRTITIINN